MVFQRRFGAAPRITRKFFIQATRPTRGSGFPAGGTICRFGDNRAQSASDHGADGSADHRPNQGSRRPANHGPADPNLGILLFGLHK
jgi:hypothetical protein